MICLITSATSAPLFHSCFRPFLDPKTSLTTTATTVTKWRGGSISSNVNNINQNNPKKHFKFKNNRFRFGKPTITITVRDPQQKQQQQGTPIITSTKYNNRRHEDDSDNSIIMNDDDEVMKLDHVNNNNIPDSSSLFDISSSIRPIIQWNVLESKVPPLPNWLPSLKSIKGCMGYEPSSYDSNNPTIKNLSSLWSLWKHQMRHYLLPSWYESTFQFALPGYEKYGHTLLIQPTFYDRPKASHHPYNPMKLLIQLSRGASYLETIFSKHRNSISSSSSSQTIMNHHDSNMIETIQGCFYYGNLPFVTLSSITIRPMINFISKEISCTFDMVNGGKGNTRAIVNLEYHNPTLTIHYSPNEYNTISPTISLYTANIIYQWKVLLRSSSNHRRRENNQYYTNHDHDNVCGSFTMKVNPLSHIQCTWTDETKLDDGGYGITDVSIPFTSSIDYNNNNHNINPKSSSSSSLLRNASVRIRRQFQF